MQIYKGLVLIGEVPAKSGDLEEYRTLDFVDHWGEQVGATIGGIIRLNAKDVRILSLKGKDLTKIYRVFVDENKKPKYLVVTEVRINGQDVEILSYKAPLVKETQNEELNK